MDSLMESIFRRRTVNFDKLSAYGFEKGADGYHYLLPLADGQMELLVQIDETGEISAQVRDKDTGDPYTLFLAKNAVGSFVGAVRSEYERILSDIAETCFEKEVFHSAATKHVIAYIRNTYGDAPEFLWEKFERMIICPSSVQKLIVVEAPDGTGKTTFIDALVTEIARYFVCDRSKSVIRHFRPLLLPNLGAAGERLGVMKQDKNFTEPHRARPANALSSFLRMTYYWFDYVIGMPLLLRKDAQFDKFTIFDRYAYDFLVDPFRTRIKLPHWIRMAFVKTLKQPKIVFVLDAPVDVIYARKQELEKLEINRQLVEFHKLKKLGNRVHILDATHSPQLMAKEAIKIIIKRIANQHILR